MQSTGDSRGLRPGHLATCYLRNSRAHCTRGRHDRSGRSGMVDQKDLGMLRDGRFENPGKFVQNDLGPLGDGRSENLGKFDQKYLGPLRDGRSENSGSSIRKILGRLGTVDQKTMCNLINTTYRTSQTSLIDHP